MDASPPRCCTPPPSLPGVGRRSIAAAATPPSPPRAPKKVRRHVSTFSATSLLPLLEELHQRLMIERRNSKEALEAEWRRKMVILMSLR